MEQAKPFRRDIGEILSAENVPQEENKIEGIKKRAEGKMTTEEQQALKEIFTEVKLKVILYCHEFYTLIVLFHCFLLQPLWLWTRE